MRTLLTLLLFLTVNTAFAMEQTVHRSLMTLQATADDVSVPEGALVYRNGVPGVFVMYEGEARFRMVRTGKLEEQQVEIVSGLFGNETLVLGDMAVLYDGSKLALGSTDSMASSE